MASGFNNNYEIKGDVFGTFFSELQTKYIHPKNIRNYNGEKAVKVFDTIMNANNIKFFDGDLEEFRMNYKHWNGMGWISSELGFYPDRILGLQKKIFVEIKSALTDTHHPAKIILEATSCKITNPDSKFFVYCDGDLMSTARKMLVECPLIDGVIKGPSELEDWVKNGFKITNTQLVAKPVNFFE
jgi:hypothetical protein